MEKVICLLWREEGEARAEHNARLRAELPQALIAAGARHIRINVEDETTDKGAALRQERGQPPHHSVAQYWMPSANAIFRKPVDDVITRYCNRFAAYLVIESTIIENRDHPPGTGERNWGWAQMAFLTRPSGLAYEEWLTVWQDRHTRVAIDTQSNFEYVQNLVVRALTPDAPPFAAIVEECFPEAALTDPLVFFDAVGDQTKFDANLAAMMESCDRFIARGTIDVIPTSQYNY